MKEDFALKVFPFMNKVEENVTFVFQHFMKKHQLSYRYIFKLSQFRHYNECKMLKEVVSIHESIKMY